MGASMDLHGGTWEEYDAVLRPEITARNGSCRWKWLHYGDVMLAFHEPTTPRPAVEPEPEAGLPYHDAECGPVCDTCGRRESEHYSFGPLHEGEAPISVCEPGQYARRWRPASDVMDCGLRRSECSDLVLHAPMAPEARERT